MSADGGRRLAGLVFLLVPCLLIWLSVAVYDKDFTHVDLVTLHTSVLGSQLQDHAEVKVRGVVVGEVRRIHSDGAGATLQLAIDPGKVAMLPANVTAQMLPTTLFGQRYVALVPPAQPVRARLTSGSVIAEDRTSSAVELQAVLNNLLPLLQDVHPAELSVTLSAISQTLRGRGAQLGQTLVTLNAYLAKLNPDLPTLDEDLKQLTGLTTSYSESVPQILRALTGLTTTTRTFVAEQQQLSGLYATVTGTADTATAFLAANAPNLVGLVADGRPTLELLQRYAPELPCTFQLLTRFIPLMDQVLGKGTARPGLHVDVSTMASKGAYKAGRDRPVYGDAGGPRCYGQTVTTSQVAGSAPENEPVNELTALRTGQLPSSLPDWCAALVGPLYRGSRVSVG